MSTWIFVRHAESVANRERWYSGQVDVPLTALGESQARSVGEVLRAAPLGRAWSSDLQRARRTAELILADHPAPPDLRQSTAIRERTIGEWARRPIDQMRAAGDAEVLLRWRAAPPGGESLADMAARALPWLAALDAEPPPPGATLIVSHGGLLRVILGLLDGMELDALARWRVPNAAPLVREIPRGRWAELSARWG